MATTFLEPGTDATQDLSLFAASSASSGTIASASDQAHTGLRSLKANVTVSGGQAYAYTPNATVSDAGAASSFYVRFSTVTPATNAMFHTIAGASDGSTVIGVGLTTGGKLRVCGRGCTAKDGATSISANTWYRVTLAYIITSSSNWSATVYLDGVSEITTSNTDGTLTAVTTSIALYGLNASASVDTFGTPPVMSVWIDDMYVDNRTDKTDPGNILVTAKRPVSNGTAVEFTTQIGAGGSGYGSGHTPQVNEQPLSATNGWSISTTTRKTEEYTIEGASVGDVNISTATIVDYMGWIRANVDSTANSPVHRIIVGGVLTAKTMTTSAATYRAAAGSTSYPAGNTDIGMDAQYTTTPHLTSLLECGLIFAYTAATAAFMPRAGLKVVQAVNRASTY
jgi:hypothetical protein